MSQFFPVKPASAHFLLPCNEPGFFYSKLEKVQSVSLYIGTIFTKFLNTDSRFQFPSNLLWSKNPETGHTIPVQGSARCCQEELFKEKHPTGCRAIKIAETLPQGECRDLSFSLLSHSLRLGLYNSMFEALGLLI